jgi:hypothetical protein
VVSAWMAREAYRRLRSGVGEEKQGLARGAEAGGC